MDVLIVGDHFSIDTPDTSADVAVVGASVIDFPIDFGPMMDRWGGGVVIARIEPLDEDADVYRVAEFEHIPVSFRQLGDEGLVLDSSDGAWFLTITDTDDGSMAVERGGSVPNLGEPPFAALGRWLQSFDVEPAEKP